MQRIVLFLFMAAACLMAQDQAAPTSPPLAIPDLIKTGQAAYMKGDYEAARQAFQQAWDIANMGPMDDPVRYDILKRLVSVRAAAGEFADADDFLQLAISWREQNLGMSDPKIADDLLLSVGFAHATKDFVKALGMMGRVLSLHYRAANGADSIEVADDFSRIGQIQAEKGNKEAAIVGLNDALELRTKILGPLDPSLVYDLDRLGSLQIASRAYRNAEATYRHALVIRETLYGKTHADLIATVDGLAYALFGQKKYDAAEPFYLRLLDLWKASVHSETHPMVATAYDKLAVFYGEQKKWDQAEAATTQANAIRAFLLADGLSGEASQRIEESKLAEALPVYERAIKILDPPNPVYDSERADLENMAAELKKVVKKPTAQALPAKKK
jgi:tetratricopeptide (TPR) repeat protein